MSNLNDDMKSTADYAINAAKQRFGHELDFSEQSIARLEDILGQIYWGFSNHPKDDGKSGIIYNTAVIWGSYLGEYIRLKWGGTWMLKDSDPIVTLSNIEISPINLVYEKITTHPEFSLENYLLEMNEKLYTPAITPKPTQYRDEISRQPIKPIASKQPIKNLAIDKKVLFILAGIVGILLLTIAGIIGYSVLQPGGLSAFGIFASATSPNTDVPIVNTLVPATSTTTSTQVPTATLLPTYTANPTITPSPSFTPSLTFTQTPTATPTDTQTPFIPTSTPRPTRTSTPVPPPPTNPPAPTTEPPPPPPPPVELESCEISPSRVPPNESKLITFIAHFSAPGYEFTITAFSPSYTGQGGCSETSGADGLAYCDGWSGNLTDGATVDVLFTSSVGDCVASYSAR